MEVQLQDLEVRRMPDVIARAPQPFGLTLDRHGRRYIDEPTAIRIANQALALTRLGPRDVTPQLAATARDVVGLDYGLEHGKYLVSHAAARELARHGGIANCSLRRAKAYLRSLLTVAYQAIEPLVPAALE